MFRFLHMTTPFCNKTFAIENDIKRYFDNFFLHDIRQSNSSPRHNYIFISLKNRPHYSHLYVMSSTKDYLPFYVFEDTKDKT